MQTITSKDNEKIKHIKKLKDKKYRDEKQQYIIEGIKMLEEAIKENADIDTIIICEECIKQETLDSKFLYEIANEECIYVPKKIFTTLTDVVNPQGILAVINKSRKANEIKFDEEFILILDNIQDPGNMGTILRTLDSVNIKQVIVSKNSADVYNPKVIRSTKGMIFNKNIIVRDLCEFITSLDEYMIYGTDVLMGSDIKNVEIPRKMGIVIGNEGTGISESVKKLCNDFLYINMNDKCESLNASVAASILMYEVYNR